MKKLETMQELCTVLQAHVTSLKLVADCKPQARDLLLYAGDLIRDLELVLRTIDTVLGKK